MMPAMRWVGLVLAVSSLVVAADRAEARPESPLNGAFEIGGSAFVAVLTDAVARSTVVGPLVHFGYRGPVTPAVQIGMTGRFGTGSGSKQAGGATGSLTLEARLMAGMDIAPYALLGLGVIFQSKRDEVGFDRLAPEPRLALPVGVGIEFRLSDAIMLGLAFRYTAVLTHLDETTGPFDLTMYLSFL